MRLSLSPDFSFVNPMLKKQYCEAFGRPAKEPAMMFKLMFMKKIYDLSHARLVSQAQTDMAVKYFLDLDPEAPMIDPSLMTKFRFYPCGRYAQRRERESIQSNADIEASKPRSSGVEFIKTCTNCQINSPKSQTKRRS